MNYFYFRAPPEGGLDLVTNRQVTIIPGGLCGVRTHDHHVLLEVGFIQPGNQLGMRF